MNGNRPAPDRQPDDCSLTSRFAVALGAYGALSAFVTVRIALDPYLSGLGVLDLLRHYWGLWLVLGLVWAAFMLMAASLLRRLARRKKS